eukprot:5451705-Pyramimonas_sp.AAC.1
MGGGSKRRAELQTCVSEMFGPLQNLIACVYTCVRVRECVYACVRARRARGASCAASAQEEDENHREDVNLH